MKPMAKVSSSLSQPSFMKKVGIRVTTYANKKEERIGIRRTFRKEEY
jgi:hypothetical protein